MENSVVDFNELYVLVSALFAFVYGWASKQVDSKQPTWVKLLAMVVVGTIVGFTDGVNTALSFLVGAVGMIGTHTITINPAQKEMKRKRTGMEEVKVKKPVNVSMDEFKETIENLNQEVSELKIQVKS